MSGIPASERNQIYNRKWHHFGLGSEYLHGWYYGGRFVPDSVFATITGADRTVGKLWEKSQPQPDVDKVDLLGRCHWTACTIVLDSWEALWTHLQTTHRVGHLNVNYCLWTNCETAGTYRAETTMNRHVHGIHAGGVLCLKCHKRHAPQNAKRHEQACRSGLSMHSSIAG